MSEKSLQDWLRRLETLHPSEIDLGLDRVRTVARELDLLFPSVPVITVAGTNGKGSTIAAMESILRVSGKKTGVFTSPHITHYNERIRVNGIEVSDQQLCSTFEIIEAGRGEISLTYFEFGALAALHIFSQYELDFLLLEVGLGGRLDAVNIIDPKVAVISSIDIDHTDWLGENIEQIALEKAGILREGIPFVCGDANCSEILRKKAVNLHCSCFFLGKEIRWKKTDDAWSWYGCSLDNVKLEFERLPVTNLITDNIACAIQALVVAGFTPDQKNVREALETVMLSGRMERLTRGKIEYIIDVSHNPAAVKQLVKFLRAHPIEGRTGAIFAAMSDKDIHGMIQASAGSIEAWFIADLPKVPRAVKTDALTEILRECGVQMISVNKNPRQALRRAQSLMGAGDRLVVFGSFYTVSDVKSALEKDSKKDNQ